MNARRNHGFTLLELLVVLVVVAIVLAMAGLVVGRDPQRQALQEASLFMQVLYQARQRAVLEGRTLGIRVDEQGYQLGRYAAEGWQMAGARHDTGLQLRLQLEDRAPAASNGAWLLIHGNDEHSIFRLHFEHDKVLLVSVSSDGLNDPRIEH